jgi:uncharacterized cupin superfamily protein
MGKTIVMHIDEAPWVYGGPPAEEGHKNGGGQLVGDIEKGPWIHINWVPPGNYTPPHSHNQDEVMYIIEGGLTMGDRFCGPGTVVFIERGTDYDFTVGDQGVRFLNIRSGQATITMDGKTHNPYDKADFEQLQKKL